MARKVSCSSRVPTAATGAGMIILGLGLLFISAPRLRTAQAQSQGTSKPGNSPAGGNLVVVGTDLRDKTINFGDELVVLITLQNQGKEPIRIPPDALLLKNDGWTGFPGGGSGLGESALTRAGVYGKEEFTLQPGETVALTGSNIEMAAKSMSPMKARFIIATENEILRRELGKLAGFTLSYYVAPSKLMISAWAARTPEERQRLQPQIRDVLLLGFRAEGWRDRFYVEGTLNFMGCYALPPLESAMKDSDPIVRQQAVSALQSSAWAADNLNFFIADLLKNNEGQAWAASVGKCDENHALRETIRLAIAGLSDGDARVRIAAISLLADRAARESNLRRSMASTTPSPKARPCLSNVSSGSFEGGFATGGK